MKNCAILIKIRKKTGNAFRIMKTEKQKGTGK